MQERKGAAFFFEIFIVVAILSTLTAIAIPSIGKMVNEGKTESYEAEFHNIQTAVTEMLSDSSAGTLVPVGPVDDMSQVKTTDTPPLVLADYLLGLDEGATKTGCNYAFHANGTVNQILP
jgi:type II secretory pathway pseudopilin PulG